MKEGYTHTPKNLKISKGDDAKEKYFIWHIQGGLGKNVAGTSLIKSIKEKHPDRKLVVVTSWPEVFLNNPNIYRVYQVGQAPYFYQDYIEDTDIIVSKHEPYHQTAHITKQKHLIHNWCDLMELEYKEQTPVIIPNYPQSMLPGIWNRSKPILVIQTGGGPMSGQEYGYSWTRDIPIEVAQAVVDRFQNEYHIIQITRSDGYELDGVERVDQVMPNMKLFSLLIASRKRVLIDSSLQHAAASMKLKSTVLWVGTSPTVFGYKLHNNIQAKLPKKASQLIGSYIYDYQFENNLHECPYMEVYEMFNVDEILETI